MEEYLEVLNDVERRRKRRRIECGLPDLPVPRDTVAAQPEAVEDEREVGPLKAAKRRKALAFGLQTYDADLETFRLDYSSQWSHTGRRPLNFVVGTELDRRFEEHPKLKRLVELHSSLVDEHAHPPTQLTTDLKTFDLASLQPVHFDCICIDTPLTGEDAWSWTDLEALSVPQIAAQPSFIWLWVGEASSDGLERGRELLAKWGYRRCEDIVWLKTNRRRPDFATEPPAKTLLTNIKEHCLMGIRGTVRRSTDAHYVHCNVDTDVIISEVDEEDPHRKPDELFTIIENFCLGTRRLHLFAPPTFSRRGWLAVGSHFVPHPDAQAYEKAIYDASFDNTPGLAANTVPNTPEVDALRPRTPPAAGKRGLPAGPRAASGPRPYQAPAQGPFSRPPIDAPPRVAAPSQMRPPAQPWPPAGRQTAAPTLPTPIQTSAGVEWQYDSLAPQQRIILAPQVGVAQPPTAIAPLDLNALAQQMGGWDSLVSGMGSRGRGRS